MSWVDSLMTDYYAFLKEKTLIAEESNGGWVEISTPFTGLFNDTIDVYAKKQDNKIILSDDGQTFRNLELSGLQITRSPKRKQILERIRMTYGVKVQNNELVTEATERDFPQKKLNLISAISEISDLYYLARHTVASTFRENVQTWLDEQGFIYTPYFISKGSTGLEFTFDFQLAYRSAEIVIQTFNVVTKMNLPHFLFTWQDIKSVREKQINKDVYGVAVINDEERPVNDEFLEALESKEARYILWSEKDQSENMDKLKAA